MFRLIGRRVLLLLFAMKSSANRRDILDKPLGAEADP
jgi:hypothetical protein